jgi:ATP-dependent helicase/nuclease subunit A
VTPQLSSDAEARRRIRESLDESLLVEASAGTGKTTELVHRIVAVLAAGKTTIARIAAVTFTNKAAGELKLRLREALDRARFAESGERRAALERALEHLEEASIGTIHAFCAQLLRERPVEARVDPAFAELSEQEAARLYQRSFRAWLERQLGAESPGLRRAFARLAWRDWDKRTPIEQLQAAGRTLIEWREFPTAWRREPFAREEEIRTLLRKARDLAAMSAQPRRVTDALYKSLQPVRLMMQAIDRPEMDGMEPDYDALEARVLKLAGEMRDFRKGSGEYGGGVQREDLIAARDGLVVWITDFRRRADADLAASLRDEMTGLIEEYESRKQRQGLLDFNDLLIAARDLVRDNDDVRRYLQRRLERLFIDEFQDTDPLQVEILMLLAADDTPGKLFLVGDPKQSIYRFRRADIQLYQRVCGDLLDRGVGHVRLTRSFRSTPNIQAFVNAAFAEAMVGEHQAQYVALEAVREAQAHPSVIALPVPKPYKYRLSTEAVNKSMPDAIAAFIAWLVKESGWGFAARDVAVLFRKRQAGALDLTREVARALEARDVEHLLAGSKAFHHREEVATVRTALTAIEWPEDELSVYATLKGSLFAIPDEVLFLHKRQFGRVTLFAREGADPLIAEVLQLLAEMHRQRNQRPFAATVNHLLEATRAHVGFLLRPGGSQILANVARVADLARAYETSGGISFRGFVEELTVQAEKAEAAEAPVLEEDSDGVRLMTVHAAKGLQFRAVILADLTTHLSRDRPELHVDNERHLCATPLLGCSPWELLDQEGAEAGLEQEEGVRVAYVAATRAQDLLVVPAVGDGPFPDRSWLSPLDHALYPARNAWRKSQRDVDGCPKFGQMSVLERPRDYDNQEEASVRPGRITPSVGTHDVVWWDPHVLQLGAEADFGVRQEVHLREDGGAALAAYVAWREQRTRVVAVGGEARMDVVRPSETTLVPPEAAAVAYFEIARSNRPGGRGFGALVHDTLRDVALNATPEQIEAVAALHARVLGVSSADARAAGEAVEAALQHPILQSARAAKRCHREYPFTLPLEGKGLMEGVIDLAYFNEDAWVVVDFKTDANIASQRAKYERQVQWYAYALMKLTGLRATGVLLRL